MVLFLLRHQLLSVGSFSHRLPARHDFFLRSPTFLQSQYLWERLASWLTLGKGQVSTLHHKYPNLRTTIQLMIML